MKTKDIPTGVVKIPFQRLSRAERFLASSMLLTTYMVAVAISTPFLYNRYIRPMFSRRPTHRAASGNGRHHSGWYWISPAFVAEFKGLTTPLNHHAA